MKFSICDHRNKTGEDCATWNKSRERQILDGFTLVCEYKTKQRDRQNKSLKSKLQSWGYRCNAGVGKIRGWEKKVEGGPRIMVAYYWDFGGLHDVITCMCRGVNLYSWNKVLNQCYLNKHKFVVVFSSGRDKPCIKEAPDDHCKDAAKFPCNPMHSTKLNKYITKKEKKYTVRNKHYVVKHIHLEQVGP